MAFPSIPDFDDADVDVEFIKKFATSANGTEVDRLGRTRRTLAGVEAFISDHGILSQSLDAQAGAEAAEIGAEVARAAAIATANLKTSQAAAEADGSLAIGASYVAPESTGALQAFRKDSSSASTKIGAPFASSVAVTAAAVVAAQGVAYLGASYTETASTKGSTAPNTTTLPAGLTYGCGAPTPSIGRIPVFRVRVAAGGTGEIHFYTPDGAGGFTVYEIIAVTVATGVNVIQLDPARYWPAGTVVHYKAVTSGQPRYDAGGLGSTVNSTAQVKGQPLAGTLNPAYANTVSVGYDFSGSSVAPVDSRLLLIEAGGTAQQQQMAAATGVTGAEVVTSAYGDTTPNTSTITAGFTYGNGIPFASTGFLDSFSVRLNGVGTGRLIIYEPTRGAVQGSGHHLGECGRRGPQHLEQPQHLGEEGFDRPVQPDHRWLPAVRGGRRWLPGGGRRRIDAHDGYDVDARGKHQHDGDRLRPARCIGSVAERSHRHLELDGIGDRGFEAVAFACARDDSILGCVVAGGVDRNRLDR